MHRYEKFIYKEYYDIETRVRDQSRSVQITPIDRSHMISYSQFGRRMPVWP